MEYLIRCNHSDWFNLRKDDFATILKPISFESAVIQGWGDHRIKVNGIEVAFSYEDPGIHVIFEGDVNEEFAEQFVDEILSNIERTTGQTGYILPL